MSLNKKLPISLLILANTFKVRLLCSLEEAYLLNVSCEFEFPIQKLCII